jgi:hypothetical protein
MRRCGWRVDGVRRRTLRLVLSLIVLALAASLGIAASASATTGQLANERISAGFYPCPGQQPGQPPQLQDCTATAPVVTADCHPGGTSTLQFTTEASGINFSGASGPFNGNVTETVTATIGPQNRPAPSNFQPFTDTPLQVNSSGLQVGDLLSFHADFTIAGPQGTITGTKDLIDDAGNWGVCLGPLQDADTNSLIYHHAPITGYFYYLTAGLLSYSVPSLSETGLAEAYVANSYATCCNSASPTSVAVATGNFAESFGTTHPILGTSGSEDVTTTGSQTVQPLGGVTLTGTFDGTGTVSATLLPDVPPDAPPLPNGFQLADIAGDPVIYELQSDATFSGPLTVCLPYGVVPAGEQPKLLHYVNGAWDIVPTTFTLIPPVVCGQVSSLSPFATAYAPIMLPTGPFQPVAPQPALNPVNAGQTVPVKFSLGGDFGLDVFASGYPWSTAFDCTTGEPSGAATSATANAAGLVYDSTTSVYTYHWQTPKSWKGQCRTLTLQFTNGTELAANFKFR